MLAGHNFLAIYCRYFTTQDNLVFILTMFCWSTPVHMQIVHQLEQVVISLIAKVLELSVLGMYKLILWLDYWSYGITQIKLILLT